MSMLSCLIPFLRETTGSLPVRSSSPTAREASLARQRSFGLRMIPCGPLWDSFRLGRPKGMRPACTPRLTAGLLLSHCRMGICWYCCRRGRLVSQYSFGKDDGVGECRGNSRRGSLLVVVDLCGTTPPGAGAAFTSNGFLSHDTSPMARDRERASAVPGQGQNPGGWYDGIEDDQCIRLEHGYRRSPWTVYWPSSTSCP